MTASNPAIISRSVSTRSPLPDGFVTFDRDWRYTYINDSLLAVFNLPREAVVGKKAWEVFPHQVGIEFYDRLNRAMTERVEIQFNFYYPLVDFWVEHRVYPTADGLAILMLDASDRQQVADSIVEQQRLQESVAEYHTLFESIDEGFCIVETIFDEAQRPIDYRFIRANPAFIRLTGLPTDALGKTARELVPDLEAFWFEVYGKVALTGEAVRFENKSDPMNRWFDVYATRVGDATSRRVAIVFNNITERKQAEAALRASEERFRNMADNAPMMVWVTDPTGECNYLSRSWYEFSGQSAADGLGFGWLEATHPDDRESSKKIFLAANTHQQAFQLEYRLRRNDGTYRTCIDSARPWFDAAGVFKGYIGSVIDIDDRKQMEATLADRARELTLLNSLLAQAATLLEERNQELDRFVHIVSHDLKAPLRAIANLSEWIEDDLEGSLTMSTQEQMNLLRSRVQRMEGMIAGLLEYARVGHQDAQLEVFAVAELLAEIIETLAPPPTFEITLASDLPTLSTKRLLLSQVFANLIGNAIKHHSRPDGSVRISSTDRGDFYEFAIADNGPGIAPEDRDRVFVIFQAANPQKNPDSSGVGLSIVKKIVETEGGTILFESELAKGTTFYFTWPKRS